MLRRTAFNGLGSLLRSGGKRRFRGVLRSKQRRRSLLWAGTRFNLGADERAAGSASGRGVTARRDDAEISREMAIEIRASSDCVCGEMRRENRAAEDSAQVGREGQPSLTAARRRDRRRFGSRQLCGNCTSQSFAAGLFELVKSNSTAAMRLTRTRIESTSHS